MEAEEWLWQSAPLFAWQWRFSFALLMHPKYRATAIIELNAEKSSGADMLSSLASLAGGDTDELKTKIETETAVIQSDSIALAVMDKMGNAPR